ncbi:hypothetical protein B0T21DRAFT_412740 [Apiosordaria backusii]|uniref:J domain-containing protein n=1 Tax=Apiosordaria backusii TaxID=314023 RepID=A0AA40BE60_9PEZI|nr:hypothetical protein B0T21DRAFT_412740 [Apiosordaria backusii]
MDTRYPFNPEPAKPDYYFDLGFPTFDDEHTYIEPRDIKAAWLKLVKQHHPDKKAPGEAGDAAQFRRVQEAYDYLRDEDKRTHYDAEYPRIRIEWLRYRKLASEEEDAVRQEAVASDRALANREEERREAERHEELRAQWKQDEANRQWEFVAEWNRREVEKQAEEQARIMRQRQVKGWAEDATRRCREQQEEDYRERIWWQEQERQRRDWEERRLRAAREIEQLKARLRAERAEREYERARREDERQREERHRRRWQGWVEESESMLRQYQEGAQERERESSQTDSESEFLSITTEQAPYYCRHPLTGWSVRFGRAECFFCGRLKGWMGWTRECPKCEGRACIKCKAHYVANILKKRYGKYRRGRR